MLELFETIKIENGKICNIEWHNRRLNKTRLELFGETKALKLQKYITPTIELQRCRVLYSQDIQSVNYFPYQAKKIQNIQIIKSTIDYAYKYNDRSEINKLINNCDYNEIIIEKNGLLTDTTIANIAFYDGLSWLTPKTPLLEGTTRARLIEDGFLKLKDIKKEDIKNYSHFALMNAMIGFQIKKSISIHYKEKSSCLLKT